ncbi:MAG TPA: M1 family aminopeptidase [Candidatus Cloacimonadota bacterium]|nr:M1 family aminopeptidase [Candidatus Cloacimonadota bacterium]HPS39481.1 M1 family aminopeptidase [Candidatus Cloacimonadota bacterium]
MSNSRWQMICLIIVIMIGLGTGKARGNQPFWSMEPSDRIIDRADSLTGFDVTKYVVNLTINDQTHFIEGVVEAQVTSESDLSSISYELTGGTLAVTQVRVNNVPSTFTHQDGVITIPLNQASGTQFTTKIYYSGVPGNSPAPYNIGLKWTTNSCYTLSNPDAGRYFWPSYDHPWDKALVDWHIKVRSDWLVAANGLRTGITDNGDGTRTHNWVCASPVATYVMGFACAAFTEINQMAGDLPIQNFVPSGLVNNATADFANLPEMISHFSSLFGPYPFEKYGHMVVSMSTYAAMEHQTMTTFGSQYIDGQQTNESIVAHELAHQWYGNYLTPITMREVWLKESFATYSEFLWEAHHHGWQVACDYLRDEIQQYYINWENSNGPHTIFNPEYNLMFAPPTYEKSASVLHMLRLKMGNENFFTFIRALLTTYPNSNINTQEFIALAEQSSGLDLTQFFQQWIYSPGIPDARVYVFSNSTGQGRSYGFSSSPTTTAFTLDVPLRIPGSAVADSVVIIASPTGAVTDFALSAGADIGAAQVDPDHWVLARIMMKMQLQLNTCLPYNGAVTLGWSPIALNVPIRGYYIFRKALPDGMFSRITPEPLTVLNWTDHSVTNGISYEYYVSAVDNDNYISAPSNSMTGTPIAFPFDQGFLVVDETRDGTGAAISPNDQMVDDFYSSVLQNYEFSQWDYVSQGAPTLSTLSHHPLVLWHSEDFSDQQLLFTQDMLGSYVLSGGNLLISGWKYPSVFSTGFISQFLPGISLSYHNSAVLVSAQSAVYPVLYPDPAKLTASWNGMIPMSYTFPGAGTTLYTAEISNAGEGDGEPLAIKLTQNGSMLLLGFPLYFMQESGVRNFLDQVLPELYPPVSLNDPAQTPVIPRLMLSPNPFTDQMKITVMHAKTSTSQLYIYNLRGQLVRTMILPEARNGISEILWDTKDSSGHETPHGLYLIRVGDTIHKALHY